MGKAESDLITTEEAGNELGISSRRVLQLIKNERLPYAMKVGRNYLIRREDLKLVKNRTAGRPRLKSTTERPVRKSRARTVKRSEK
jgi:excisionase family DNA binding protein